MMGMFGQGGPPEPKGDISQLWKLLGVEMYGDEIVWQDYNPEPKSGAFLPREFIFVDKHLAAHAEQGTPNPFDPDDPISSGLGQVLFLWPGRCVRPRTQAELSEAGRHWKKHGDGNIRPETACSTHDGHARA
jgi:hypothetical protein